MAETKKDSSAPVGSDEESTVKVTPRKEIRPNGTIKLKRPAPKHNKPGNWRDGSVVDDDKKKGTDSPSTNSGASPGPVVNQLDDSTRDTFATGRPLEDSPETSLCKHCKKSVLKSARKAHIEKCLSDKKEAARKRKEAKERAARRKEEEGAAAEEGGEKLEKKKGKEKKEKKEKEKEKKVDAEGDTAMGGNNAEGEEDDDDPEPSASPEVVKKTPAGLKSAKKTAGKKSEEGGEKKQGKKRKAEGDAEKMPKQKKKKDEPKAKIVKAKVPVDVERQCGVITPNGVPCARSLTCKSHSMGAKRAVPGRSLPYDMLLAAYQKKNQAKQQKAAIDANAPLEDEDDANAGPIDSDEETALVMSALSKWNPQPYLPQPVLMPIKRQYQLARLREQLDNATSGGTVNIFKVAREVVGDVGEEDAVGERDEGFSIGGVRRTGSGFATGRRPEVVVGR
ncbi:hypothetical protein VE00_01926 [Pseudogymnoascus sp. WSF 3629]|nr:hypothetical protein VE00_01926 [Pseudogymnoascus sp. WSF 3629]